MEVNKPKKAVVLVGGEGTRLRPLTYKTSKAMVPVLNIPFIQHVLYRLNNHNVSEIILAMGYRPDSLKNYFGKTSTLDVHLIYSIEQTPLGTAGALKNAAQYIGEDETLFVLNGDIFTDLDLTEMFHFHRDSKSMVTIAVTAVPNPAQFGVIELDNQQRVTEFREKPSRDKVTSNLINAGVYIVESEILKRIPQGKRIMFEHDIFPQLIADGAPVYGYSTNAYWIDMGTPEKYLQLNHDLLRGKCCLTAPVTEKIEKQCQTYPQTSITGPVVIDKDCTIGKSVQVKGPSIIGSKCSIGDNAIIEESILWTKVRVGERATLKNCIITSGIEIKNKAYIENAVIGQNTNTNQPLMVKFGTG